MKKNRLRQLLLIAGVCCIIALTFANCQSDDYYYDGGKHNPYYNGTVWSYLNSRPDYFKTLVEVIDIAGMKNVFDGEEEITFFAPTDWSIKGSVKRLSDYLYATGEDSIQDLRQIKPEIWKEFLSLYIVPERLLLKDVPQIDTTAVSAYPGSAYYSYGGRPMNAGVVYYDANGVKYAGARQLIYSYVNDFATYDMKNAYVATSDIQPTNGVVHVIRFTDHNFGFNVMDFVMKALNAGIVSYEQVKKEEEEENYEPSV